MLIADNVWQRSAYSVGLLFVSSLFSKYPLTCYSFLSYTELN
ncbi:hypothetical protein C802_03921 [Phocaeicola sartorii]|uniref:Uncharacterized protein n=1 Tax=Phocaeicola sartorii TaxID=671267 RepID=R9HZF7_9BACT|nr:hypothetical protein C802_03921 [Phocaeicola sartorii]